MILKLTKKTKIIVGLTGAIVAAPTLFAISQTSTSFQTEGNVPNVYYSSLVPSIILKNKPNDVAFSSPVSNSKYIKPPVIKKPPVIIKTDDVKAPKKEEIKKKEEPPKVVKPPKKEVQVVKNVEVTPPPPKAKVEDKPITEPDPTVTEVKSQIRPKVVKVPAAITPVPQPKVKVVPKPKISVAPIVADVIPKITTSLSAPSSVAKGDIDRLKALAEKRRTIAVEVARKETERQLQSLQGQLAEMERSHKEDLEFWKERQKGKFSLERYNELYEVEKKPLESDIKKEQDKLDKINDFDVNHFTQDEIIYLKQGQLPSQSSPFEWEYVDPSNDPVVKRGIEQNSQRVLNMGGYQDRTPEDIIKGKFKGWTKSDISTNLASEGITGIDGTNVSVQEYSKDVLFTKKIVRQITLNAENTQSFDSFASLLEQEGEKINPSIVVIKNIGESGTQDISKIIKALPQSVEGLTLYVDDPNSLKGIRDLENHKLKELALYTNNTKFYATDLKWEINPNAIKNVGSVSFDYFDAQDPDLLKQPNDKFPSSIIFNTLRWDEGDNIEKVNEGLKLVFDTQIYQKIFEGKTAKKGDYPDNLDFSDSTSIKTLKDIDFTSLDKSFDQHIKTWKYEVDPSISYKKPDIITFNRVVFGATQKDGHNAYEAKISDFQNAQFTTRMGYKGDKAPTIEIKDSKTGKDVKDISLYLDGDASQIQGDAKIELEKFVSLANDGDSHTFNKIIVSSEEVKKQLGESISNVPVEVQTSEPASQKK